jgi:hypothetical protein
MQHINTRAIMGFELQIKWPSAYYKAPKEWLCWERMTNDSLQWTDRWQTDIKFVTTENRDQFKSRRAADSNSHTRVGEALEFRCGKGPLGLCTYDCVFPKMISLYTSISITVANWPILQNSTNTTSLKTTPFDTFILTKRAVQSG